MIHAYSCETGRLTKIEPETARTRLDEVVWVDLENPSSEEIAFVEQQTGLDIPVEADLAEIESSSRLSAEPGPEGQVLTLSMPLVRRRPNAREAAVLGVVLAPSRLVTVRFAPSVAFEAFLARAHEPAKPRSADILIGLIEAIVDRQADALEEMRAELNRLSDRIFHVQLDPKGRNAGAKRREQESELRVMVTTLGRLYDSLSMVRDSQLGIGRAVPYITAVANWMPKPMTGRLKVIARDVASLNEFITHLSDKVQFVLDATLGLINISQNDLMKILTIVSVIGIPPTVIVGIYGMNFVHMPELHWHDGYYYALSLLAATAVVPLAWFRRKGWL